MICSINNNLSKKVAAKSEEGNITGVMGAIDGLESGLSLAMNSASTDPMSIYQILDQSLGKGFGLVMLCFQKANGAGWRFGSVLG